MDFTMWLGPLPIHWVARIEQTTPVSFVDRQVAGPFESWRHLHTYVAHGPDKTLVIDQVEAELSDHWWWKLVGMGMWLNLPDPVRLPRLEDPPPARAPQARRRGDCIGVAARRVHFDTTWARCGRRTARGVRATRSSALRLARRDTSYACT